MSCWERHNDFTLSIKWPRSREAHCMMLRSNWYVLTQSCVGSEPDQCHIEMTRLGSNLSRTKATEHSSDGHIPHNNDNHNFLSLLLCHRNRGGSCMAKLRKKSLLLVFWVVIFYIWIQAENRPWLHFYHIQGKLWKTMEKETLPGKKSHEQRS